MSDDASAPGRPLPDAPAPLPLAQRVWLFLTQAALVLPFVTARDCANGTPTEYTGFGLYAADDHAVLLAPLAVVTLLLFAFPYRSGPVPRALPSLGLHAFVAGIGTLLAFGVPPLLLLFEEVTYHVGWYLHVGGWAALYAALLVGAATVLARGGGARPVGREAVAIGALLAAPPLAAVGKLLHDDVPPGELLGGVAAGTGLALPLVLAGLGLARQRADGVPATPHRAAWWILVAFTLGVHVVGALAD